MKFEQNTGGNGNTSDVTPEQWKEWNEYYLSLFGEKESVAKKKDGSVVPNTFVKRLTKVGIANFFLDVGLQPQPDSEYKSKLPTKGTEDGKKGHGIEGIPAGYSAEEKEHVKKYPDNYFKTINGERIQFKPERPTQEIYVAFDVPSIMVDWTKHPLEQVQKLGVKPLRVSMNGYFSRRNKENAIVWEGFAKSLRFNPNWKTGKLSPNNPINKLASALSCADKFESSGYDFDVLLGQAANVTFELRYRKTEQGELDRVFDVSFRGIDEVRELEVPSVGTVTREQQIPQCDIEPVSVMLNQESFDDQILDIIGGKRELKAVLPKATSFQPNATKNPDFWLGVNWEDTNLCKALEKHGKGIASSSNSSQETTESGSTDKEVQSPSVEEKPVQQAPTQPEPEIDFDDD